MKLPNRSIPAPRGLIHPLAGADYRIVKRLLADDERFRLSHLGPRLVSYVVSRLRRDWIAKAEAEAASVPDDWHRTLPPIFVLGFWRSGTTLLHELLAANPEFAAPSLIDVLFPADAPYLLKWKRRYVGGLLPPTRMTDAVAVTTTSPQEEELAVSNLGAPSFFGVSYFPHRHDLAVDEAMFFDDHPEARERWRAAHSHFLRLLTLKYPERRLLLKNPANSTRIPDLLELYPDALFVRTERAAEQVIPSFMRMQSMGDQAFSLQSRFKPRDREAAEAFHARVIAKLDADWELIPESRRSRVHYDDVLGRPMRTVEQIYLDLGLEMSQAARRRGKVYWKRTGKARTPVLVTAPEEPAGLGPA